MNDTKIVLIISLIVLDYLLYCSSIFMEEHGRFV